MRSKMIAVKSKTLKPILLRVIYTINHLIVIITEGSYSTYLMSQENHEVFNNDTYVSTVLKLGFFI